MAASKPARITITKIEGARRQIEAAVALWFQDGDPVVVHTLVAAGHQVCNDILRKPNGKSESPVLFNTALFPGDEWELHRKFTVKLENFLKHAKRDPSEKITFNTAQTEMYILDAILLWHMIERERHPLFEAFGAWFFLSNPTLVEKAVKMFPKLCKIETNISRSEFLSKYLKESG